MTAGAMRCRAEHTQSDGEITHSSYAKAWKHFNTVHPDFVRNIRNVYLDFVLMDFVNLECLGENILCGQ